MLKSFTFNPVQENTYILYDDSRECIIIDPGCWNFEEFSVLKKFISDEGLKPVRFLCTHCHFDHIWGAMRVFDTYGLKPEFHAGEQPVYDDTPARLMMFGFETITLPPRGAYLSETDTVVFGNNTRLELRLAPGHSPASLIFYVPKEELAVVGDVIFYGSIGRTDLPGGSYPVLMNSIFTQILALPPQTRLFNGHGNPTTPEREQKYNPFILEELNKKRR